MEASAAPAPDRSRRVYVWWGVGFAFLAALGSFCWLVVAPIFQAREAVRRWAGGTGGSWIPVEIERLGGPDRAARSLSLYLRLPERWAPMRGDAVVMLGSCADDSDSALPGLERLLADADAEIRRTAAEQLARFIRRCHAAVEFDGNVETQSRPRGMALAVEVLVGALSHGDPKVRSIAVGGLGNSRNERARGPLLAALHDADKEVRWGAAWAVGEFDGPEVVAALEAALRDPEPQVVGTAMESLARRGQTKFVEPFIAILQDRSSLLRWRAANALGDLRDRRAVEPLIEVLNDPARRTPAHGYLAHAAAEALGKIGDRRAVEPLIDSLSDNAWGGEGLAVRALGQIGDPRAVEPLIAAIRARSSQYSREAVEALAGLADPRVLPALIAALEDEAQDFCVRENAVRALGTLGDPRAVEPLRRACGDPNVNVHSAAREALEKVEAAGMAQPTGSRP
jgi:HEAT repeat protein